MPTGSKKPTTTRGRIAKARKSFLARVYAFMDRRPHRSFRLTKRRDYIRPLELPGYISFTHEVTATAWRHRKLLVPLVVIYVVLYAVLVGLFSQESYANLSDTIKETGEGVFNGGWGKVGEAGLLLLSVVPTSLTEGNTELQQMFALLLSLMLWLTIVWLLRNIMAGHKVKLRDGIYSSGSPIFATMMVALFMIIQLLPVALAAIGYVAALNTGVLDGGAPTMLFWVAAALMVVLSLYWVTSSLFAMVIITLPGAYPYSSIKAASDIVVGRRVKILLRWLWMVMIAGFSSLVVLLIFVLIDMGIKNLIPAISWLPIVPFVIVVVVGFVMTWISIYVYLLYRKVVDYVP